MEKFKDVFKNSPDLPLRAVSSIFIVGFIVSGIVYGGMYWNILVTIAAMLSLWEYHKMVSIKNKDSSPWIMMAGGFLLLVAATSKVSMAGVLSLLTGIVMIVLFNEVVRRQKNGESNALKNMGAPLAGIAYIILPWSFMIMTRKHENGMIFLLTLFFCTWCCDVAAYFVGSRFGKRKLCSNVSPNKSWEGFFGGVGGSIIVSALLGIIFPKIFVPLIILGVLCGTLGQLGDLAESVLKREAGIKDSGHIIPGHGGFLDRFDSILVNAVVAFVIIESF